MRVKDSTKGFLKIFGIIFAMMLVLFFRDKVCERVIINGQSMEKNFHDSDVCWADKRYETIERYDVVVADVNGELIIKRVIGLPGDMICISDGSVYINEEKISPEYDFETFPDGTKEYEKLDTGNGYILTTDDGETVSDEASFYCSDDEYFLMGDNRQHSADSRLIGAIKREDITGKIVIRFYPFNRIKLF